MADLLWHAQSLFQFTDPCRYSGGVRPSQPLVGLLFPVGPLEVVRAVHTVWGTSFSEPFLCKLRASAKWSQWTLSQVMRASPLRILIRTGSLNCVILAKETVSSQDSTDVCTVSWTGQQMGCSALCQREPYICSFLPT